MKRVLSLYLPMWPTQRVRRRCQAGQISQYETPVEPAILLAAPSRGRQVIAHACEIAQAAGVRPGMDASHARALLGERPVHLSDHQPDADRAALIALARWAMRFSPLVAPDPPDGLFIDIGGCQRLFGGEERMMRLLRKAMSGLGFTVRLAIAPTIGCAWAVARFGPEGARISAAQIGRALEPLPVSALRIDEQVRAELSEVAVDRVGQLLAIPRDQLADRFGGLLLRRLDEALGQLHEAVQPLRPAAPPRVEREFPEPIRQREAMQIIVRDLLSRLSGVLEQRGRGARRIVLSMERLDTTKPQVHIELGRPSRDPQHLWKLLRVRLEKVDLGWGVERFVLEARSTGKLPHTQSCAWAAEEDRSPTDSAIAELVDLLAHRLGTARIHRMQLVETHTPEKRFESIRAASVSERSSMNARSLADARGSDDRPSLLLDRAEPIRVVAMAPQGPVVSLSHGGQTLRIITSIGPERIAPRWWLTGADDHTAPARDYFKLQDERGRWWWVYRKVGASKWFVQGMWA